MRRMRLRRQKNVLKRALLQVGRFNLSLALRRRWSAGVQEANNTRRRLEKQLSGRDDSILGVLGGTAAKPPVPIESCSLPECLDRRVSGCG